MNVIELRDPRLTRTPRPTQEPVVEITEPYADFCAVGIQPSEIEPVRLDAKDARRLASQLKRSPCDNARPLIFERMNNVKLIVSARDGIWWVTVKDDINIATVAIANWQAQEIAQAISDSRCVERAREIERDKRDREYQLSVAGRPLAKITAEFCDASKRVNIFISGEGPFPLTFKETDEFWFKFHMVAALRGQRPRSIRNDLFALVLRPRQSGVLLEAKTGRKFLQYRITPGELKRGADKVRKISHSRPSRNGAWT